MSRTRTIALLAALAVAGTLLLPATVAGRVDTDVNSRSHRLAANPYIGTRPSSGAGVFSASALNIQSTSTNWAGYTVQTSFPTGASDSVSDVKATWVVPRVTGGTGDAYSADWIGIDGFSSPTVEQIGTEQDWISGGPAYSAWWEMYPGGSVTIDSLSIRPGDLMNAEVRWNGASQFILTLTDVTTSQSFQTVQTIAGGAQRRSAEWVVEAPADGSGNILPLAHLGPSPFTVCDVTINGVEGPISGPAWQADAMTLVASKGVATLAIPSGLAAAGSAFVVTEPGVDAVAPTTTSDAVASYDNVAVIHLTATDGPDGSGVAATHYRVDAGADRVGTVATVSTYGTHHIAFWSVDVAGNTESPHVATFMVDDTIPPTTSSDARSTYWGPASIRLTALDNVGGSGVAATRYMVDGVVQQTYAGTPVAVTAEGAHAMTYWSVDNAGNTEATRSVTFTISLPRSTVLSFRASASSLARWKYVGLASTLSGGLPAGTLVRYEVRRPGSGGYVLVSLRPVNGSGVSSYRYKLMLRGTYYFRARFLGSPGFSASVSAARKVVSR